MTEPLPPVFEALVNVPGYLPMADQPSLFDTAEDAWEFLACERERDLDSVEESPEGADLGEVEFMRLMAAGELPSRCRLDGTETVFAATPGYFGDHDLGLAYTVKCHDHALHCGAYPPAVANPSLPCLACELISMTED